MGSEIEWFITAGQDGHYNDNFFNGVDPLTSFPDPLHRFERFWQECLHPQLIAKGIRFAPKGQSQVDTFLKNGDRFYLDTGGHVETGVRECASAHRLVVCEKAAERAIEYAIKQANLLWDDTTLRSYKCNLDRRKDAYGTPKNPMGSHENYLVRLENALRFSDDLNTQLGLFLVSRILFTGAGWMDVKNEKFRFNISQRALVVEQSVGEQTTNRRSVINTRDEPLAGPGFRRVHLIIGDALLMETALFLKYGTTAKVVEAVFSGVPLNLPFGTLALSDTEKNQGVLPDIIKTFSADPSLRAAYKINGSTYTMIDIQEIYLPRIKRFWETERDMTPEDEKVFSLWEENIVAAKSPRPHEALSAVADWAAEMLYIEMDMDRRGYQKPSDIIRKVRKDGATREIKADDHVEILNMEFRANNTNGLFRRLPSAIRITTDKEIEEAMTKPEAARSKPRVEQLGIAEKMAQRTGKSVIVSMQWDQAAIKEEDPIGILTRLREFKNPNPYSQELGEVSPAPPLTQPSIDPNSC